MAEWLKAVALLLLLVAGPYLVFALMWWQSDVTCRRCGKKHWDFDHRMRCLERERS